MLAAERMTASMKRCDVMPPLRSSSTSTASASRSVFGKSDASSLDSSRGNIGIARGGR
jgi:hypothetical protein